MYTKLYNPQSFLTIATTFFKYKKVIQIKIVLKHKIIYKIGLIYFKNGFVLIIIYLQNK